MRIAVTGGSGRLGRSVVSVLRNAGHRVVSVDKSEDADIVADLLDPDATAVAFAGIAPDAVVHLAAIAVPFSAPERHIFTVNTTMAFTVLEAALASGATRVLTASSPTVMGYSAAGWVPDRLPLDEAASPKPANAYALSKLCVEQMVAAFARSTPDARLASFRPCFVIPPEEWGGAPTQSGHTVLDRLLRPELAAVALFNYVDARDAGEFVLAWLERDDSPSGACYFVGAADAFAVEPLSTLLPRHLPATAKTASGLTGTAPAFSSATAERDLGWTPRRSWRTELSPADLEQVLAAYTFEERPAS